MTANELDRGNSASNDQLKSIARAAAERSSARRNEEARRSEEARLAHERRFEIAVAALEAGVIPILEQAKLTFESESMPAEISTNFGNRGAPRAHVVFECSGSFVSDMHGKIDLAASDRAIFFHDGTDLHFGIAKSFSTDVATRTRIDGDVRPQVLAALEEVVESFFRDVERRERAKSL